MRSLPGAQSSRACAAIVTVGAMSACRALVPEPAARAAVVDLLIIPLAYGHLLGALAGSPSLRRLPDEYPTGPFLAFVGVSLCSLFALYSMILGPYLLIAMATVAVWHVIENDLALARSGSLTLGPIPGSLNRHVEALGILALAALVAASTSGGQQLALELADSTESIVWAFRLLTLGAGIFLISRRCAARLGVCLVAGAMLPSTWIATHLELDDLVVAPLLYHSLSWLHYAGRRVRDRQARGQGAVARRSLRLVTAVHLVPLLLIFAAVQRPDDTWSGVYLAISSPAVFFFFSVLHVVHTAWVRGVERAEDYGAKRLQSGSL